LRAVYKVYWTETPPRETVVRKDRLVPRQYRELERAMDWARQVHDNGGTTWLIEGDDGTRLRRHQVVAALDERARRRAHEHAVLVGRTVTLDAPVTAPRRAAE